MIFTVAIDFKDLEKSTDEEQALIEGLLNRCWVFDEEFTSLGDATSFAFDKAREMKNSGEAIRAIRIIEQRDINYTQRKVNEPIDTLVFDENCNLLDIFYYDSSLVDDERPLIDLIMDDPKKRFVSLSACECYEIIHDWLSRYALSYIKKRGLNIEHEQIERVISSLPPVDQATTEIMELVFSRILSGSSDYPLEGFYRDLSSFARHGLKQLKKQSLKG